MWARVSLQLRRPPTLSFCCGPLGVSGADMRVMDELRRLAFPGTEDRLNVIAALLLKEEIECVSELAGESRC